MQADHECRRKQRRREIEYRDANKNGDEQAGDENNRRVLASEFACVRNRSVSHCREFEIFSPEQISVSREKCQDVETRREPQQESNRVDEKR